MKPVSKIITAVVTTVTAAALALGTGSVFAKDDKRQPDFERLAEKLELSEAQTVSFVEIMKSQFEKRKELRETARAENMDRSERKALKQSHKQETLDSLSTILSEEQLAKVESMMKRGKKHRHGKKGKDKGTEGGETPTAGVQS